MCKIKRWAEQHAASRCDSIISEENQLLISKLTQCDDMVSMCVCVLRRPSVSSYTQPSDEIHSEFEPCRYHSRTICMLRVCVWYQKERRWELDTLTGNGVTPMAPMMVALWLARATIRTGFNIKINANHVVTTQSYHILNRAPMII